jgi:hypothetical protein
MRSSCDGPLASVRHRQRVLGTKEFFVTQEDMIRLLRHMLGQASHPVLSLNRPQAGGPRLVHRIEWLGLIFRSVSLRPITVS